KQTGVLESQQITDKEVMTVPLHAGTREDSVPAAKRRQPSLRPRQAGELADLGTRIEQLYGQPMDVEWALSSERVFILQARPITALAEPTIKLDWKLPRVKGRYARKAIAELLPEPLSPLFATLALPCWNDSMRDLIKRLVPPNLMGHHSIMLVTIN